MHRYILDLNACYMPPTDVAAQVMESFGVEIDPRRVEYFDPTKSKGYHLRPDYVTYFHTARLEFEERVNGIGISHKSRRLQVLDRALEYAWGRRRNIKQTLEILEQAAREVGANNKPVTVSGLNGSPNDDHVPLYVTQMTPAQLEAGINEMMFKARDQLALRMTVVETRATESGMVNSETVIGEVV